MTVIVTGANSGVGFETAKELSRKGMEVIMACRSEKRATEAKNEILKDVPDAKLKIMILDLGSLDSVRTFVKEFKSNYNQLDILINNAGVMIPPYTKTEDGFELQLGVNYLSHFLLTGLLLDELEKSGKSRVITLSSLAHKNGKIHFDDMNFEKSYNKMEAYGQSKLACLMFAYELDRRLKSKNSKVISLSTHPGVSPTNLMKYLPKFVQFISPIFSFMMHDQDKAAEPSIMAATKPDLVGGEYFGPTGYREMKGKPGIVDSTDLSKDIEVAKKLWAVSEEMVGYKYLY